MTFQSLIRTSTALISILALTAGAGYAQTVPGSADPVRTMTPPEPLQPKAAPSAYVPPAVKSNVTSAAAQQFFVLNNVSISGMTVYYPADFKGLYSDMVGKQISVADIQRVADAITQQYRADGYVLAVVSVPKQEIANGVIALKVNEGRIANIIYEGEQPQDDVRGLVNTYANKIKEMTPLKSDGLERYLLLINDLPGNTARALLRPSATEAGATDIVISYKHKYIDGLITTENHNSRYLGPWQNSVTVAANSVLGMDERTVVRYLAAHPTRELRYFEVQHEEQLGSEGTKLQMNLSQVHSNPGDVLEPLNIIGSSDNFHAFVSHPVVRSRLQNLTVRGGVDIQNSITDILGTNLSKDRVRSLRVGGQYDVADSLDGVNQADLQLSQGIKLLGATDNGVGRTRINGEQAYSKVNLELARTQALPYQFSVYTAFSGQYSLDPLLTSEQFVLGGARFGSAYDPGELSGDQGAAGKVELRYGDSVGGTYLDAYQLFASYDMGKVWLKEPLASERSSTSLSSVGFGVRANFTEIFSGSLEATFPLTKDISAEGDKDSRIFSSLSARF